MNKYILKWISNKYQYYYLLGILYLCQPLYLYFLFRRRERARLKCLSHLLLPAGSVLAESWDWDPELGIDPGPLIWTSTNWQRPISSILLVYSQMCAKNLGMDQAKSESLEFKSESFRSCVIILCLPGCTLASSHGCTQARRYGKQGPK